MGCQLPRTTARRCLAEFFVRALLVTATAWVVAACSEAPVDLSAPVQSLPIGVLGAEPIASEQLADTERANLLNHDGAPYAWILRFEHDTHEPLLLAAPETGLSGAAAFADDGIEALVGSGFVTEVASLEPVGLLQLDGRTLNPLLQHGYTRILGIADGNTLGVLHRDAYQREIFHAALQAGPGVIEAGALDISERDLARPKYFRAFVVLCDDSTLIGASLEPTHLRTLGERLLTYFESRGLACSEVVNLAGDREALLMRRHNDGRVLYQGDPNTHKVALIAFRRRSP